MVVGDKIADLENGYRKNSPAQICAGTSITQPEAAKLLGVSRRGIQIVRQIRKAVLEKI